jgi:hypothetical protein
LTSRGVTTLNYQFAVPDCFARAYVLNHLHVLDGNVFFKVCRRMCRAEIWVGMSITIRMDAFSVEHPFVGSDPSGVAMHMPDLRRLQLCPKILILHFGVTSGHAIWNRPPSTDRLCRILQISVCSEWAVSELVTWIRPLLRSAPNTNSERCPVTARSDGTAGNKTVSEATGRN